MKPKPKAKTREQPLVAVMRLDLALDMDHELVRLAQTINLDAITADFRPMYCPDNGRPAVPTRLMAGLQLLKHTFRLSDDQVVHGWVENPYWPHRDFLRSQFFCGEEFFRHKLPIHPTPKQGTALLRLRQRIGEKGVEKLLQISIEAGKVTETSTEVSFDKIIVDTTVQPKAVQHSTEARLYRKVHTAMLRIAEKEGLDLRQRYWKLMVRAFRKHGGHAKAKQFKPARRLSDAPSLLRLHLGKLAARTGIHREEGLAMLDPALREPLEGGSGGYVPAHVRRGQTLRDLGRKAEAEAVLRLDPKHSGANKLLEGL
jgi:transposase, IS5 family